jgi:hypothetical protein
MERLNKFFYETSLWLVFPISWVLTGSLLWLVFFTLDYFCYNLYFFNGMTNIRHLTIIILLGIPFGIFFTFVLFAIRESKIFWDYAKEVEKLIDETDSVDDIVKLYENEWEKLRKMYIGDVNSPQRYEVIRLRAMIEIKYKTLNKLNTIN